MTTARNIANAKLTIGSTAISLGSTAVTTISGLTLSGATLTGSLTAGGSAGTSGYLLSSTGTGVQWITPPAGYLAPTIGSTQIASNTTYTTLPGVTSVNGISLTPAATGFSIAGGTTSKSLTISNTMTLAGTDGQTYTYPSTSDNLAGLATTQTFTAPQTIATPTANSTPLLTITPPVGQTGNVINFPGKFTVNVNGGSTFASSISASGITSTFNGIFANTGVATSVGLTVKGFTSQSADLTQWQNTSGTVLLNINASGVIGTPATSTSSTNSAGVSIQTGNATGTTSNSGGVTIDSGTATGTVGSILIGNTNATTITIGRTSGVTTTINGTTIPASSTLLTSTTGQASSTTLTGVAGLSSSGTGLVKNTAGTWSYDTNAYITGSSPTITTPIIDSISASAVGAATSLHPTVTTGSIAIGAGLTTGALNIAASGTGITPITIGHTNATIALNGAITTSSTINKVTITAPTTSATLTLITGSTLATNTAASLTLGLSSAATTVATIPSGTVTLVDLASTQALTGKTISGLTVSTTTGTLTIPAATIAFSGANNLTFTTTAVTSATIPSGTITLQDLSTAQSITGVKTFSTAPVISSITNGAATLTLPTATGTLLSSVSTASALTSFGTSATLTTPTIDVINAASATGTTQSLFPNTTTGTINIGGASLTTGTINIGTAGTGVNPIVIGKSTSTITLGALPTAGFVKTSATGLLSIDTNTYLTTTAAGTTYSPLAENINTTAKTAAYQLTTLDANTLIQMNGAFAFQVDTSLATLPLGTKINLLALTSGVSVATTANAVVPTIYGTPGLKLRAQYSSATLIKLSAASASGTASTWLLVGDLSA